MSTIRVDNFGPSAGGTAYSARGIAKAWLIMDASSGTPTFNGEENFASMTDLGAGIYYFNFTNPMADANYPSLGWFRSAADANWMKEVGIHSTTQYGTEYSNSTGTGLVDLQRCMSAAFGDLA